MPSQCHVCHASFANASALKTHQRAAHQSSVSVKTADGSKVTVNRCPDSGTFICPISNCNAAFVKPQVLQRHCARCHGTGEQFNAADDESIISSTPHSVLTECGLVADPDLCVLMCRKCRHAINPNARYVRDHIKGKHAGTPVPTLKSIREAIEELDVVSDDDPQLSDLLEPKSGLVEALPSLVIHNGFQCRSCAYYCREKEAMRHHCHDNHMESRLHHDSYAPCLVQTLFKGQHHFHKQ